MKLTTVCLSFFLMIFVFSVPVYAVDKTSTGFYWPIGTASFDQRCGTWLGRDSSYGGCYFSGLYHIGVDMMRDGEVYAIADGEVFHKHCSDESWGTGNCALFIRHKTADQVVFTAVYGHLRTSLNKNDPVKGGKPLGVTGPWSNGKHLHLGIRYGDSIYPDPWGRLANSNWSSTNNFIDPIAFIQNNAPYVDFSDNSRVIEATVRKVGDVAWYPPNVDCLDAQQWFRVTPTTCYFTDRTICFEIMGACPAF